MLCLNLSCWARNECEPGRQIVYRPAVCSNLMDEVLW